MTPVQHATRNFPPVRSQFAERILRVAIFFLVQIVTWGVIFWAGVFTLLAAFMNGDPDYVWAFLLIVGGFEVLTLRILLRRNILILSGLILFGGGIYLLHHDANQYNERTCHFIKQSTCQEMGDGFMCRRESAEGVWERTITRDDITACNKLDEL
jgi:hypothetical protein